MTSADLFDAAAIVACALMAVLVSIDRHRRFGAAMAVGVLASVTGGSLRDILLGETPVFWMRAPWQIYFAILTTAVLYLALRKVRVTNAMLWIPDALSVALPAAIAAKIALPLGLGAGIACVVGLVAGMAGGILRDVICEREPAILKRELYGTAALLGAGAACLGSRAGMGPDGQVWAGAVTATVVRMAAVRFHLSFGDWVLGENAAGRGPRGKTRG